MLQLAQPEDDSLSLNPKKANTVQKFVGKLLYYARTLGTTIILGLNTITVQQSKSTQETEKILVRLLNYAATHPEAIAIYHAIGMALHMHYPRTMDTHRQRHKFHDSGGRLWDKIQT